MRKIKFIGGLDSDLQIQIENLKLKRIKFIKNHDKESCFTKAIDSKIDKLIGLLYKNFGDKK